MTRQAMNVLADRMACALAQHEPGWRLPRHTALARRFNVSTAEVNVALEELAARHLIRRLPDGQAYRASPAEYVLPIEGVPGLASRADPMGTRIVCRSCQVSLRQAPDDIGWALGVAPADPVCVVRVQWAAGDEPAAVSTTYLLREVAGPFFETPGSGAGDTAARLTLLPVTGAGRPVGEPRAVQVEMQPPPPAVARSLRLPAGRPAVLVTVRFDSPQHKPVGLTIAAFRPDLFRIVVQTQGSFPGAWTHAAGDWEP